MFFNLRGNFPILILLFVALCPKIRMKKEILFFMLKHQVLFTIGPLYMIIDSIVLLCPLIQEKTTNITYTHSKMKLFIVARKELFFKNIGFG